MLVCCRKYHSIAILPFTGTLVLPCHHSHSSCECRDDVAATRHCGSASFTSIVVYSRYCSIRIGLITICLECGYEFDVLNCLVFH
jgi:hypothetical protein